MVEINRQMFFCSLYSTFLLQVTVFRIIFLQIYDLLHLVFIEIFFLTFCQRSQVPAKCHAPQSSVYDLLEINIVKECSNSGLERLN